MLNLTWQDLEQMHSAWRWYFTAEDTARTSAGTKKSLNHRGHRGHREENEESSGDSLSVTSECSVVKHRAYAEGIC